MGGRHEEERASSRGDGGLRERERAREGGKEGKEGRRRSAWDSISHLLPTVQVYNFWYSRVTLDDESFQKLRRRREKGTKGEKGRAKGGSGLG